MSLFKAREWWATKADAEEEFDAGCMCVGNLDNHPDGEGRMNNAKNMLGVGASPPQHSNLPS